MSWDLYFHSKDADLIDQSLLGLSLSGDISVSGNIWALHPQGWPLRQPHLTQPRKGTRSRLERPLAVNRPCSFTEGQPQTQASSQDTCPVITHLQGGASEMVQVGLQKDCGVSEEGPGIRIRNQGPCGALGRGVRSMGPASAWGSEGSGLGRFSDSTFRGVHFCYFTP